MLTQYKGRQRSSMIARCGNTTIRVGTTCSFRARLAGLVSGPERAIVLFRTRAIHTFGMKYPLDIWYLAKNNVVLKVVEALPPMRLSCCLAASTVIEIPHGWQPLPSPGQKVGWQALAADDK